MSPPPDNLPLPPGLEHAERVQIANLVPENLVSSNAYIDAQIALVWPYSSSTRQFAFLLSEPDARPLKSRRQVKIALYNGAARAVQSSKVGIGDQIRLVLRGCQWRDSEDPTATPGKRIKWDLVYRKSIALEVKKTASEEARFVQYESTGTPSPRSTPLTNGTVQSDAPRVYGSPDLEVSFDVPASRRTSGIYSYTGASEDPFLEDIEKDAGKSRKRTKFSRPSGSWRLLDDDLEESTAMPSSPSERQVAVEDGSQNVMDQGLLDRPEQPTSSLLPQGDSVEVSTAAEDGSLPLSKHQPLQQADGAILPGTASIGGFETDAIPVDAMGPPTAPVRPRPDMRLQLSPKPGLEPEDKVTTPRLHPMSSQGLPLISPLVKHTGAEIGYFPDPAGQSSELDAISHPATEAKTAGSLGSEESEHDSESDKSVVAAEQAEMTPRPMTISDGEKDHEGPSQTAILIEDNDEVETKEAGQPTNTISSPTVAVNRDAMHWTALPPSEAIITPNMADDQSPGLDPDRNSQRGLLVNTHPKRLAASSEDIDQGSQVRDEETEQGRSFRLEETRALGSPIGLIDGIVESQNDAIPGHVRLEQGNFQRQEPKLLEISEPHVTVSTDIVAGQNRTLGQSTADKPSQLPSDQHSSDSKDDALTENAPALWQDSQLPVSEEQLMTPAQSQNLGEAVVSEKDIPVVIPDQEPLTPQATQTEVAKASFEQMPDFGKVSTLEMKDEDVPTQLTSATSRRVSQRLTRKAEALTSIESPFFTRRKTAKEDRAVGDIPAETMSPQFHEPRAGQSKTPEPEQYGIEESASVKGKQAATYKGTNTALAYYPSLAQLHEYYGQTVDIMAVCAETTSLAVRAKKGPQDWHTTLRLVDPDTTDAKTIVQVFRPYKEALPFAQLGDILILRSFKVQTAKGKWTLLSTDSSAWAAFKSNPGSRAMFDNVEMTGPQLEYGRGETAHVKKLVQWWADSGRAIFARSEGLSIEDRQQDVGIHTDPPFEEAAVLESVEQATSPRRSRRLHPEADTSNEVGTQSQDSARNAGTAATPQATPHEATRRARTKTPNTPPRQLPAPSSSIRPTASDTSSVPPVSPRHTRRHTRSTLSPAVSFSAVGSLSAASSIAATSPTDATFGSQSKSKSKAKVKVGSKGKEKDAQQQQAEELQSGGQHEQPMRSMRSKNTKAASPPLVHELRDGMRYVDEQEGEAPPKRATRSQVHELRDGNRYVDDGGK